MWIVLYEHNSGRIVCSLYEDEAEAEREVQRLRCDLQVNKAWKIWEQVFYSHSEPDPE
jgi:hypothetical protein